MADNDDSLIELDYKQIEKKLKEFEKEIPGIGKKLINAVNNVARRKIRAGYRARGYKAKNIKPWGDAGYSSNIRVYANRDFSGKIMMSNNAFFYRFVEFGTNHKPMIVRRKGKTYKVKGFSVPAKPLLYPIANSVWKTEEAVKIMEEKFEEELKKRFGEN